MESASAFIQSKSGKVVLITLGSLLALYLLWYRFLRTDTNSTTVNVQVPPGSNPAVQTTGTTQQS